MSSIERLEVSRVRNLTDVRVRPCSKINIIFGSNGSGKTSFLESVYLLGLGRSFRSSKLDPIIQDSAEDSVVFGQLNSGVSIGVSKSRRRGHILKLQGEKQRSWAGVARHLPVQVINSDSFSLLEGSPRVRRRFLDWGVFHVEHGFIEDWRRASKCIAQRNLLLKQRRCDLEQVKAWDNELSQLADRIDTARAAYFKEFVPVFESVLSSLIELPGLSLEYSRGWSIDSSLGEVLVSGLVKDQKYGATQNGPHRADVLVKMGKLGAGEVLSRGQQKLLVCALKISQGLLLENRLAIKSVYLVDDLPAELDSLNRKKVCGLLESLETQVFLSCVDPRDIENCWSEPLLPRKFHVEHGKIAQV
jgi:DNA replication and repair protein RecF